MYFVISGDTWNLKKQLKKNSVLKQKNFVTTQKIMKDRIIKKLIMKNNWIILLKSSTCTKEGKKTRSSHMKTKSKIVDLNPST